MESSEKKRKFNAVEDLRNTIINGECVDFMKSLPDECIDITITSPPYNKRHLKMPRVSIMYSQFHDSVRWEDYYSSQVDFLNELYRITKNEGHCIYVHKVQFEDTKCHHPMQWISKTKWTVRQEIVWNKIGTPNTNCYRFYQKDERIYWLYKPSGKTKSFFINPKVAKWGSVWRIPHFATLRNDDELLNHPAKFQLFLILSLLYALNPKGDEIVFDPYIGSGTTAKAAQFFELDFLGCEIDPVYVDMSRKRLVKENPSDELTCKLFNELVKHDLLDLSRQLLKKDFEHLLY